MRDFIRVCISDGALGSWVVMIFSIILLALSFWMPPTGIIDPSVLTAVGEVGVLGVIFFRLPNIISSIKDGKSISIKKGGSEIAVSSSKD